MLAQKMSAAGTKCWLVNTVIRFPLRSTCTRAAHKLTVHLGMRRDGPEELSVPESDARSRLLARSSTPSTTDPSPTASSRSRPCSTSRSRPRSTAFPRNSSTLNKHGPTRMRTTRRTPSSPTCSTKRSNVTPTSALPKVRSSLRGHFSSGGSGQTPEKVHRADFFLSLFYLLSNSRRRRTQDLGAQSSLFLLSHPPFCTHLVAVAVHSSPFVCFEPKSFCSLVVHRVCNLLFLPNFSLPLCVHSDAGDDARCW